MEVKKLKIIPFDGKQDNWNMCSSKFKRKLTIKGFRYFLEQIQDDFKEEDWDKDNEDINSIEY